ncbi:hypothetical protein GCM10012284_39710 [Mangrovihabitans endophyticus]|uniref:NodB homology domain-containing protein n=2 Tax=Mangrovihabitans endophyticus TaxID=1751298 RepID=A0A8J3FPH0_9ACTN|nr:hypothetical protein GCM10012284_39710 [Mangrovihabitans endophyticus]
MVKDETGYPTGEWPSVTRHETRKVEAIWSAAGLSRPADAAEGLFARWRKRGRSRRNARRTPERGGRGSDRDAERRGARHDRPGADRDAHRRPVRREAPASGPRARHAAGRSHGVEIRPASRPAGTRRRARPGATGTHRAPGTVPLESWLLVGKPRQQAVLVAAVVLGLLLVGVPMQRRALDIDPVNAANQAAVEARQKAGSAHRTTTEAPATTAPRRNTTAPTPAVSASSAAPAPTASAPATATTPTASPSPAAPVPDGDGPAHSLLTTGSDAVALTFDDGPDPVQTPKILAMLADRHITATFCLVGQQVRKHPEIVRQIAAAGHTLCNHTWSHSLTIGKEEPATIQRDLQRTNAAIRQAVPDAKIPFFRAPGGNFTDRLVQVAYADKMASLYWKVDPRDWEHDKDEDDDSHITRIVTQLKKDVKPGAIVLSHDFNQPDTIAAYQQLLPWLTENFTLGVPQVPPLTADTPDTSTSSAPPADPA